VSVWGGQDDGDGGGCSWGRKKERKLQSEPKSSLLDSSL